VAFVPVSLSPYCLGSCADEIRFDWFFKSRTPEELRRRGATLLLLIMKDKEPEDEKKGKAAAGKVCRDKFFRVTETNQ
jgi:hypothetical protein